MCFAVGSYLSDGLRKPLIETRTGRNTWVGTSPRAPRGPGRGQRGRPGRRRLRLGDLVRRGRHLLRRLADAAVPTPDRDLGRYGLDARRVPTCPRTAASPRTRCSPTSTASRPPPPASRSAATTPRYGDILGLALTRSGAGWTAAGIPGAGRLAGPAVLRSTARPRPRVWRWARRPRPGARPCRSWRPGRPRGPWTHRWRCRTTPTTRTRRSSCVRCRASARGPALRRVPTARTTPRPRASSRSRAVAGRQWRPRHRTERTRTRS